MALGSVGSMVVAVLADTRDFDKKMGTSTTKVNKFQKGVTKMGAAITKAAKLAAAAAAAAVVAFGVSAVKTFVDFDTEMRQVFTLMPDLSSEAKDVMIEDVMELSEAIGILPSEIIPALYQAISAGVPRENVFTYLEIAGEAAIGGAVELESMVVGLAQVMNAYGSEVDTARGYSDMFFSIVADGITTMGELSSELYKVAPTAADLGISFSSIAGWMAELTSQGVLTSVAASRMNVALGELSKAGTIASDTFEKAAGVTFPKFIDAGGTLADAFEIIGDYAADSDISVKDMFGSIEAGGVVLQATGVHFDAFSEKVANAEEAAGNTKTAYEEMADGIKHELDKIAAWWERLQTAIGKDLTKSLQDLLSWLEENQEAIGKSITAIFNGLLDSLKWLQENATLVKTALITVAAGFTLLWVAANPVAASILAVVAALAYFESEGGVAGVYDELQDLAQAFRDLVTEEGEAVVVTEAVASSLVDGIRVASNAIKVYVEGVGETTRTVSDLMGDVVKAQIVAVQRLQDGMRFDEVVSRFNEDMGDIAEAYGYTAEQFEAITGDLLDGMVIRWSAITGVAIGSIQKMAVQVRVSSELMSSNLLAVLNPLALVGGAARDTADKVATGLIRLTDEQLTFYKEALARAAAAAIVAADLAEDIAETNEEIAADYASMWERVAQYAATALVDMVTDFVDMAGTREEEEKTHQENLQSIRDEYAEGSQTALETALGIAQSEYETHRTGVAGTLRDMFGDFTAFLADELLALAAAEAVKSAAAFLSLNPVLGVAHAAAGARYLVGWGALSVFASSIPGYAEGGVVPGPIGAPQIAVVHGGEPIGAAGFEEVLDYEKLGQAVTAGFLDAQDEMGGGPRGGSSSDLVTKLAQLLYDPLQVEEERRGGVA